MPALLSVKEACRREPSMHIRRPMRRSSVPGTKKRRRRLLLIAVAVIAALVGIWGYLELRSLFRVPDTRLALDAYYPEMPPDDRHRYLVLPIDHTAPERGSYKGFYLLSPGFRRGAPVVFLLTDGQMELVNTHPDFAFFDKLFGEVSYVLIGVRGHAPTLFPEVYRDDGSLDLATAMALYGSDQQVEDIEAVRRDLERSGDLPPDSRIAIFGASGAGVLAQQYLAKHGRHVTRTILQVTGAPDLARSRGETFTPAFAEFHPEGAALLRACLRNGDVDTAGLSYVLYQLARARPDARQAQRELLQDGCSALLYRIRPQYSLALMKFMMRAPSAAAAKVRWHELAGHDLARYAPGRPETINLMYEFAAEVLGEFREMAPKEFQIDRAGFDGEVLVISGTEDVVFSTAIGRALAEAYPNARLALFEDCHRLSLHEDYYRELRAAFLTGGFGSSAFQRLYDDPRQLDRPARPSP
ncbi:hypothetical protein OV203_31610 [Nannocystis sp. ILAH1]|uniref:alpha/beta fold hydrolase n=1 Tax=Nannocystis sp. ILAH1 TaxID=2996789 RepID=UPI00226D7A1F|nr:hypothetical protein [Nannocystis sp. ILAH1]MCY0991732.1 hypothetical protein [Nannocystis sp. ILAH1]